MYYEVQFLSGSRWEGSSITFGAPVTYGPDKNLSYLPDSFFDCEKFLRAYISGCDDELNFLLIDLTSELCMEEEYKEDPGEFFNYIYKLHKEAAIERASYQPKEPLPLSQCLISNQYRAGDKWIATGKDGTVLQSPEGDSIRYLTDLYIDSRLDLKKGCVITLAHAQHTCNETVIEFQSPTNMPGAIPLAALQAIQYIRMNYSEIQDLASTLVIGCTGWMLYERYNGGLEGMYLEAADLYEKYEV